MGHAGYGPLDSDDAMAVIEAWEDLLQKKGMSPARATRALLDEWGDVASSGREAEVMALTAICLRKKIPIGKRLREAAVTAINNDLAADALEGWMSPTKRKNALLRLLKSIGGRRRPPTKGSDFKHPHIHFRNTAEARRTLLRLAELSRKHWGILDFVAMGCLGLPGLEEENVPSKDRAFFRKRTPKFMKDMWHVIARGIKEESSKIHHQATRERMMMLACWVGIYSHLDSKEMQSLLDTCIRASSGNL